MFRKNKITSVGAAQSFRKKMNKAIEVSNDLGNNKDEIEYLCDKFIKSTKFSLRKMNLEFYYDLATKDEEDFEEFLRYCKKELDKNEFKIIKYESQKIREMFKKLNEIKYMIRSSAENLEDAKNKEDIDFVIDIAKPIISFAVNPIVGALFGATSKKINESYHMLEEDTHEELSNMIMYGWEMFDGLVDEMCEYLDNVESGD
jgi:hypothetical protein